MAQKATPLVRYVTARAGACIAPFVTAVALGATAAAADQASHKRPHGVPSHNLFGSPGLIEMPSADTPPDATLSTTIAVIGDSQRSTLSFQILPRLSGSFRYSSINNFDHPSSRDGIYYDRSFDLRYQILTEGKIRPSVVIGLQDFIGTGLYGGEYIVATKTLAPGLKVTGGLGWGRLGSHGSFAETGSRPTEVLGEGGIPTYDRWFRGPVAGFGGVSYAPNDRWNFKLEYSSDDAPLETARGELEKTSPWNFGIDYRFGSGSHLSLYHAYGTEIGAQLTLVTNPKRLGLPGGNEAASYPIKARPAGAAKDLGWADQPSAIKRAETTLRTLMEQDGLKAEAIHIAATRATVRLRNKTYGVSAQAIGRTARAMSHAMPASVEEFVIVPVANGLPVSAITLRRSDLERLEHAPATQMLDRTVFRDAHGTGLAPDPGLYPEFDWSIAPYSSLSFFDPGNPIGGDFGIRAKADWRITPNLSFSGSVIKKIGGNLDDRGRGGKSSLPRVRTDQSLYSAEGDPAIEYLYLAHYGRPGPNLYSRLTLGYLESMYAGVSGEVLWKPVGQRLALGAELNYVQRRDFDQLFGLQDMTTTDPVTGIKRDIPHVNGHVSAYYNFGNGFHGQLDMGRYLAGDYGATLSVNREFANGWKVGAYATVTDTSFEDFGEGSFDKGLRLSIPLSPFIGTPSRRDTGVTLQSLSRDGGSRLRVRGRLYDQVREYHQPDVTNSWGKFWR